MMDLQELQLRPLHRAFTERFVRACESDDRILAACLIGSYAKGKADPYSDIDLSLITTDSSNKEFYRQRKSFLQSLGELVFLEHFGIPDIAFYIYADGTEGELYFDSESRLDHLYSGPFQILLDKRNLLTGLAISPKKPDLTHQTEQLRNNIYWFWHEMSHFITAMGRGQHWWARGQLDELRSKCVHLARLQNNFTDPDVGDEPYFKLENSMPVERLAPLETTFCPMDRQAMLQSARVIVEFYVEIARSLAERHNIAYPESLESLMRTRLKTLQEE